MDFFQDVAVWVLLYGRTARTLMKTCGRKTTRKVLENPTYGFEQILDTATVDVRPLTSHLIKYPS